MAAEARGFILGAAMAARLGAGFVPARKPGKLPRETASVEYALEYGVDALEVHSDALAGGARVLVHDDLLATGGTAAACCQLVEAAGAEVVVGLGENEAARVCSALDELGAREVQSLLLEGGPHLAGAFLEADEIDEARIFVAPLLTGGREAKTAVEGIGIERIAAAPRALHVDVDRLEDDVLIVARLKDW